MEMPSTFNTYKKNWGKWREFFAILTIFGILATYTRVKMVVVANYFPPCIDGEVRHFPTRQNYSLKSMAKIVVTYGQPTPNIQFYKIYDLAVVKQERWTYTLFEAGCYSNAMLDFHSLICNHEHLILKKFLFIVRFVPCD
jgi:hypothetical protein